MTNHEDHWQSRISRAYAAIEKSRVQLEQAELESHEPIAIVGAGCRLPGGVRDLQGFWSLLSEGRDAVTEIPEQRWQTADSYDPNPEAPGTTYSRAMGVIDDALDFDAQFFGISPREAESMDPQQRVLLAVCWEALESAGVDIERMRGSATGVFVGISTNEFSLRTARSKIDLYGATGRALSTASGRISYAFGFQGPALSIDTACSSSLVAVHLACQSLRRREVGLAIAAGVHVSAGPEGAISLSKLKSLSPTGRCRAFSNDADGYVRGEGCAAVVLKRISDARALGDPILAVIRATGVNQDGRSNGLTAPSRQAQETLLRSVLEQGKVKAADVGYVEAHGTGTQLGDPIELGALASVYGAQRGGDRPLWIGSVKTNIGHLEAAAGLAGLLKALLVLRHQTIPPSLHFKGPNPFAEWDLAPIRVATELSPLPAYEGTGACMVGVSSFGFSGTNAHAVLERAPDTVAKVSPRLGVDWLALSAKNEQALRARARQFAALISQKPDEIAAICRSARRAIGRLHERVAIVMDEPNQAHEALIAFARGDKPAPAQTGRLAGGQVGRTALVFSGQGGQWPGMGRRLYARSEPFREAFLNCDQVIRQRYDWSPVSVLSSDDGSARLSQLSILQPVLFSLSVALYSHIMALGLEVDGVIGHSMGELAAAYVSGSLCLDDAIRVICERSRLLENASDGAMAVLELGEDDAQELLHRRPEISIAATNGPRTTVLSGSAAAMRRLVEELEGKVYCRTVAAADCASHSPHMDPLLEPLISTLQHLAPCNSRLAIYSTVTGGLAAGAELDAHYWASNLRERVRFYSTLRKMIGDGYRFFVEISPHPVLLHSIQDILDEDEQGQGARVVPAMRRDEADDRTIAEAIGAIFACGACLRAEPAAIVTDLPPYPWQTQEFPLPKLSLDAHCSRSGHWLLGRPSPSSTRAGRWVFEGRLPTDHLLVTQHRVHGAKILPAASYIEMAIWGGQQLWPHGEISLSTIQFQRALTFADDEQSPRIVELEITEEVNGRGSFRVSSRHEAAVEWVEHARGLIHHDRTVEPKGNDQSLDALRERLEQRIEGTQAYNTLEEVGYNYGDAFRLVKMLWTNSGEVLCQLDSTRMERSLGCVGLAPTLLDAALHGLAWFDVHEGAEVGVPASVAEVRIFSTAIQPVYSYATFLSDNTYDDDSSSRHTKRANIRLFGTNGEFVAELTDLQSRALPGTSVVPPAWIHAQSWIRQPRSSARKASHGSWLVLASPGDPQAWLEQLSGCLGNCSLMVCDLEDDNQVRGALVEQARASQSPAEGIVILVDCFAVQDGPGVEGAALSSCTSVLHVLQSILTAKGGWYPMVCIVTRATQDLEQSVSRRGVGTAAVWGLARSLSVEHPELHCRCIDLPTEPLTAEPEALSLELLCDPSEREVALRSERWVGRLKRTELPLPIGPQRRAPRDAFRVEIERPGRLDSLSLRERRRQPPGPGQVEVRVDVAALNFADVMHAMGFFKDDGEEPIVPLGSECAGEIVALGPGVERLKIGQEVVALGKHCLGSHVTTSAEYVWPRPAGRSASDAASLPIAAMTAWHALIDVGRVKRGERVLIHSASGGTGLAAVQIAQLIGAELYATAGSAIKREYLRARGIAHVFDSRSLDFAEEILTHTRGEGVDVVLNSLSGAALERSLAVLGPDGRFLELGKRDIYEGGRISLEHFRRRITYAAIDLRGLERQRPDRFRQLFHRVMEEQDKGHLSPLPVTTVPISQVGMAFHTMASAEHIGKVALSLQDDDVKVIADSYGGTQLITGGLGGLGLKLAKWLIANGARDLILVGRSARGGEAAVAVDELQRTGARVHCLQSDISIEGDLERALACLPDDLPAIRGIFHLAGVLEDGLIERQSSASVERVLAPKIGGAWALHRLASKAEVERFVVYSSASAILPAPAQANYAAANCAIDAFAAYRRSLGLPTWSVQWGPFSDTGLVAGQRSARLADRGAGTITTGRAHQFLRLLLSMPPVTLGIFPLRFDRWLEFNPALRELSRFDLLKNWSNDANAASNTMIDRLKLLELEVRKAELEKIIAEHLVAVLRLQHNSVPRDVSFPDLGLDSLTGLELRNRLEGTLGVRLSTTLFWRYPTLQTLARQLSSQLFPPERTAAADPSTPCAIPSVAVRDSEKWFMIPRQVANPQARLFCFPYLGGLSGIFSSWAQQVGPRVEIRAIQLPGRPPRAAEQPWHRIEPLVDAICAAIAPLADRPYAFYGHSLGALTAYEVACTMRERNCLLPGHLFLAAYPAPTAVNPIGRVHELPLSELIAVLSRLGGVPPAVLDDKELLDLFLPSLRADLAIVGEYKYRCRGALPIPATLFGGERDDLIARGQLEAWQAHLQAPVALEMVPGPHLFLKEAEPLLLARIVTVLAKLTACSEAELREGPSMSGDLVASEDKCKSAQFSDAAY